MNGIRPPAVAGLFYPASADELRSAVSFHLSRVPRFSETRRCVGIVSPHAGYVYSGYTAAHGFRAVENGRYKTVIILSPSHQEYFRGVSVYSGDAYSTPFGEVSVNRRIADLLLTEDGYIFSGIEGHRREHAVEVQLPFLQHCLGAFDFVPVVMGDQNHHSISLLAVQLSRVLDDTMLVVASSDLSHFYPRETANRMDGRVETHLKTLDADSLEQDLRSGKAEACGGGPMAAMIRALKKTGKETMKVLCRCDSGDVSGDTGEVVGYLSAAMYRE